MTIATIEQTGSNKLIRVSEKSMMRNGSSKIIRPTMTVATMIQQEILFLSVLFSHSQVSQKKTVLQAKDDR